MYQQIEHPKSKYEDILDEVENRIQSGKYKVVNATGVFEPFEEYYPELKFVIPKMSIDQCKAGDKFPCVAIPCFETGELAGRMMHEHLSDKDNKPLQNKIIQLKFNV